MHICPQKMAAAAAILTAIPFGLSWVKCKICSLTNGKHPKSHEAQVEVGRRNADSSATHP